MAAVPENQDEVATVFEEYIPYEMRLVMSGLVDLWRRTMDATGYPLSPVQFEVLSYIDVCDGVSLGALARYAGVESPTMTQVVQRLEELGYVNRYKSPEDQRRYALHLNQEGRRALRAAQHALPELDLVMFQDFSDGEKQAFSASLRKLRIQVDKLRSMT